MTRYRDLIVAAATPVQLEPALVQAVAEQESAYDPWAYNPEQKYRYFWNVRTQAPFRPVTDLESRSEYPPPDFRALVGDPDQEWWAQQASWGLMQIMGAVAREHGFVGLYLTQLVDPAINLQVGCAHLAGNVRWARRLYTGLSGGERVAVTRSALAAYNGGKGQNAPNGPLRNRAYADAVLARYDRIKKETP